MLENIINTIGSIYSEANAVNKAILWFLSLFTIHRTFYNILGFFCTRKFKPAKNLHKYAILIPARNEESVIRNLIDSIKRQDYPAELITIFVVADNCTDKTAEVARNLGAVCYERFNDRDKTKGFALQFLFENIEKDYGISSFDGYFIFDSDNLLNKDYISKMNNAFDSGLKIITSYRNTKNFDENWIAASYGLHWLRSIRYRHRARSVLRLATNIQGTGFLFANELVKDGWHYTSLTEDRAFTADAVAKGYQISYQDEAMFYDEQPTNLRIALRQRLRWAKGHLMAFVETGWALFVNILLGSRLGRKCKKEKLSWKHVLEDIRHRWASFDTLSQLIPTALVKLFLWIVVTYFLFCCTKYATGMTNVVLFKRTNFVTTTLNNIFGYIYVDIESGPMFFVKYFLIAVLWRVLGKINYHLTNMLTAVYVFIVERKRIKKIPLHKKIFFCITWPIFDMIHRYCTYVALFKKVTWKPIPHTSKVTIEDIEAPN